MLLFKPSHKNYIEFQPAPRRVERETALHAWVSELLNGHFVQQQETPSYVELSNGIILHMARLHGIVVSTEELVIDDGTGSILVRTFDNHPSVAIGDTVLIIGRVRVYEQQLYILGEIVKKINTAWVKLAEKQHPKVKTDNRPDALAVVRTLDKGEGADYNEVAAHLGTNGEELIIHLLATGEIFETRPGKLKVLE